MIALALALSPLLATAPPASRHVQARLAAEVASVRPGVPFTAGLLLRMDPGWHTYWKNPGDSGLATRLRWTMPEGFAAGPIEWPYPRVFTQGPVTSYGYEGEVLLPVTITPPASVALGTSVTLAARADWLECRDACLPGRAELTLALAVRAEAPRPSAEAPAFASARERAPHPATGWTFAVRESGERIVLAIAAPTQIGAVREARFFPDEAQVIDNAAAQTLSRVAGSLHLALTPDPNARRPLRGLTGVLVAEGTNGTRAVRVDTVVRSSGGQTRGGARPPGKE